MKLNDCHHGKLLLKEATRGDFGFQKDSWEKSANQ
jgi:hypothetical protein